MLRERGNVEFTVYFIVIVLLWYTLLTHALGYCIWFLWNANESLYIYWYLL